MEQYRINDLERLTGIKAHTIRIWEKRYQLITPSRTSTNRRYYNSEQLLKLMNVATLLFQGHKISNLAALSEQEIKDSIEQIQHSSSKEVVVANYINELTYAMLGFDEVAFEKKFAGCVAQFGMYEGMLHVFYPFLRNTGVLWRVNKSVPVEEHFASNIIRKRLILAADSFPPALPEAKKFLLFLPSEEWHEIALLFANYIVRSQGASVVYLGQNVPVEDIEKVYDATKPDYILTFFISPKPTHVVQEMINAMVKVTEDAPILISGSKEMYSGIKFNVKKVIYLKEVANLFNFF